MRQTLKVMTIVLLLLSFVFFNFINSIAQNNTNDTQPNVLIILTDDQGYHDVSYYGTADIQTPNIDQIATSGIRLDNFYSNSPVCSPTRAALMSGQYQDYVGVPGLIRTNPDNNWGFLDPNATLLSEVFQDNGYHTALVGKWNLGLYSPNKPNERGFDHFHGWLDDMTEDFWEHSREGINYMRLNEQEIEPEGHVTELLTEWSVDYIEDRANHDEPFFLFLSHLAPHFPVQPPEDWFNKVREREPDISDTRANLVAFIEHLDAGIGQVLEALKRTEVYDNTIVIFTSDNGGHEGSEANNGPYRGAKEGVYEGGIRVPTAVSWPDKIESGTNSERILLTMDIFPTVLEAAGITYNGPLNGISFLPTLLGEEQGKYRDEPLYFTRREGRMTYGGLTIQAVRMGNWKLVHNSPFAPRELYNLKEDPYEKNNLIDKYPEKVEELNALMMKHIQKSGAVPWQRPND